MLAILFLLIYELCGVAIIGCLLPRKGLIVRLWLGMALGLALGMWLPALCAFIWTFSVTAQVVSLLPLLLLTALAWIFREKETRLGWTEKDTAVGRLLLWVALPLTVVGAYLQWTHTIRPVADAYGMTSLHVGQSTYGDLPLHLAITTSLRNASFPPEYSILPGALLTYPFLADSLSAGLMLLGLNLRFALLVPGVLMTGLVFAGYVILAHRMADTGKGAALAALFFFLNGGLGFLYLVDMQGRVLGAAGDNELQSVKGLWERIRLVLGGWYQTPANHDEFLTYNLRWSNTIVDMMVPQRTTLAGWCQVIPCIYLLYDALRPERPVLPDAPGDGPAALFLRREIPWRQAVGLGVWAGMLPMVNTHCFLALGLLSGGWMACDLIRGPGQRRRALAFWGVYGGMTVLLAAPQLFTWTFRQAVGSGAFLRFQFNWVNGALGMPDGYFWFWIKNVGLPFLLILMAVLEKNEKRRFLASGAFVIFLAAELIQFQPNIYDNNKLFYIWYMVCCVIAADYGLELLGRWKGMRARPVAAVLAAIVCFFTGTLAVARECVSDYPMFPQQEIEAARYVEEFTPEHATFLTGTSHINFVSSLAGRNIVCGPDNWLVYHGFDTRQRQEDIIDFYADPVEHMDLLSRYQVDYVVVSDRERYELSGYQLAVDDLALDRLGFERVYESDHGGIVIYAVPGREQP